MSKIDAQAEFKKRIKEELKQAGVTRYGLLKMESRHLSETIHPEEHIKAVIYGIKDSFSAMLVATDLRVIYLERKPFFSMMDEVTYELVAGIGHSFAGHRASVTLHTRVGNYTLRFVNRPAAEKFIAYIEKRRVEVRSDANNAPEAQTNPTIKESTPVTSLTEDGMAFLHEHHTAVISTIDRTGNAHGAVIYYFVDANHTIYILTKDDTAKTHNILVHPQVAMTVYDSAAAQTLQLQGMAQIEPDKNVRDFVFRQLSQPRKYNIKVDLPPVTKLDKGGFIVLQIKPTNATFRDFSK